MYSLLLTMTGVNLEPLSIDGTSFKDFRDPEFHDHPVDHLMGGRWLARDWMRAIDRRWLGKLWD